jgi:CheY-like chemotaxis protein
MNKKVLVIDDDEGILSAFEAVLEGEYTVETFSNPELLQTLHEKNLPDLILLDVLLSGADGRDICKQLKNNPLTKNIPIIMISAHPGAAKTIKKAGADDYVAKPFEMDELLQKIAKYTKR